MNLDNLSDNFAEFAKDVRLNLTSLLTDAPGLTSQQMWGIALACTYAGRSDALRGHLEPLAGEVLSPQELVAAKGAAALMAQNNVFYRTMHLLEDKELSKMPSRLRMNLIARHGIAKVDFELYCLAVSAMGGCGACVNSHVAEVRAAGVTQEGVHSAIRIAAAVQGAVTALAIGS